MYNDVDNRGVVYAQTFGPAAGDIRSSHPQNNCEGAASWMGYCEAYSSAFRRCSFCRPGFVVPCAPSARTTGLASRRVERFRSGAPGEGLFLNARGPETTRTRTE